MVRTARSTVPRPQIPTGVAGYLLATGLVAAALLLRMALTRVTGELPPFVIFFPTVALVALLLGAGPGIVATLLAAVMADYFILKPVHGFGPTSLSDTVALGLFVSGGLLISLMAARVVRARRGEAAAAERARVVEDLQQAVTKRKEAEAQVRLQAAALEAAPKCHLHQRDRPPRHDRLGEPRLHHADRLQRRGGHRPQPPSAQFGPAG